MKGASKGAGNRYANDCGGNHLERLRKNTSMAVDPAIRRSMVLKKCDFCGLPKEKKGGTSVNVRPWKCRVCKDRTGQ